MRQGNSGGTVLDQINYAHDAWGMISEMRQDPDSSMTAGASDSGRAEFVSAWVNDKNSPSYDGWQTVKTYSYSAPSQGDVSYGAASSSIDDQLGRTAIVSEFAGYLAAYDYLGAGTAVSAHLVEPNVGSVARLFVPIFSSSEALLFPRRDSGCTSADRCAPLS